MTLPDAPAALAERIGHTMVITLNRPAARNAVNSAVSTAVGDAMAEAQADPRVRVVILTGAGDKSFCAGADLKAISRSGILTHPDHPEWGFAGFARHAIDKPPSPRATPVPSAAAPNWCWPAILRSPPLTRCSACPR